MKSNRTFFDIKQVGRKQNLREELKSVMVWRIRNPKRKQMDKAKAEKLRKKKWRKKKERVEKETED